MLGILLLFACGEKNTVPPSQEPSEEPIEDPSGEPSGEPSSEASSEEPKEESGGCSTLGSAGDVSPFFVLLALLGLKRRD